MGANERHLQNETFQKTFLSGILKREFACRENPLTAGCQRHIPPGWSAGESRTAQIVLGFQETQASTVFLKASGRQKSGHSYIRHKPQPSNNKS